MSDAQRRLQDLLAGWTAYVSKCAAADDEAIAIGKVSREQYEAEADAIMALYQRVGSVDKWASDNTASALNVILDLLRHGPAQPSSEDVPESPKDGP